MEPLTCLITAALSDHMHMCLSTEKISAHTSTIYSAEDVYFEILSLLL